MQFIFSAARRTCVTVLVASLASAAYGQATTVKVIGATFVEAPPGRDKNLVPFAAGFGQEKVEVYAIISSKDRLFVDLQGMSREQSVTATGMLANKTMSQLGSAEIGGFAKVSADKRHMAITLSVTRLPDSVPLVVIFAGTVNVRVARGQSQKTVNFVPKVGTAVDFGIGDVKISSVDATSVTLAGGSGIERIAAMKFVSADGRATPAERSSYGRSNDRYEITYKLPSAAAGKLEATLHDGLETISVPIQITATRPY